VEQTTGIDFRLLRKPVKNIRIRVTGASEVVVSAPHHVPENRIAAFVERNKTKIIETLDSINKKRLASYPARYSDGETFLYLGKKVRLKTAAKQNCPAVLLEDELVLRIPEGCCPAKRKSVFENWAKRQARAVFTQRVRDLVRFFPEAKDKDVHITVKNMLSRWGSINAAKNSISLTVHLLRCDPELIDYVIAHELCHLAQRNHSKAFYSRLEEYFPDRKKLDARLKKYGLVDF